jgi:hypothetical protein
MKLYSNKSNAKRAAIAAYGSLDGLVLHDADGMFAYAKPAPAKAPAKAAKPNRKPPRERKVIGKGAAALVSAPTPLTPSEARALGLVYENTKKPVSKAAAKAIAEGRHVTIDELREKPKAPAKKPAAAKAAPKPKRSAAAKPAAGKTAKLVPPGHTAKVTQVLDAVDGTTHIEVTVDTVKTKPKVPSKAALYHIEKDRPTKHGMTRPSSQTVGGKLWDGFDAAQAKVKDGVLQLAQAKDVGAKLAQNATSTTIAFYRWRRFQGVRGRGSKQKID